MNPIRRIRRIAGILAGLACAWIGLAAAAPAAFAMPLPPGGSGGGVTTPPPVQVHTVVAAGMTGWQIALIAIGAALLAATIAVLLDRARTARRNLWAPRTSSTSRDQAIFVDQATGASVS